MTAAMAKNSSDNSNNGGTATDISHHRSISTRARDGKCKRKGMDLTSGFTGERDMGWTYSGATVS